MQSPPLHPAWAGDTPPSKPDSDRQGGGGQVAGRRSAGLPTARAATCPPCSLSSPAQSREGARGRFPG